MPVLDEFLRTFFTLLSGNNKLEFIPPQVSELRNLEVLNVALNRLQYLPAELVALPLKQLTVHPNPFIHDPSVVNTAEPRQSDLQRTDFVGPLTIKFSVPSLAETVMRFLISPASPNAPDLPNKPPKFHQHYHSPQSSPIRRNTLARTPTPSNLTARFALPLSEEHGVPLQHLRVLSRIAPGLVARSSLSRSSTQNTDVFGSTSHKSLSRAVSTTWSSASTLFDDRPSSNTDANASISEEGPSRCPSPKHLPSELKDTGDWTRTGPLYISHAEECYVWTHTINSLRIGEATGGVPLLWRGCERGCLDFLFSPTGPVLSETSGNEDVESGE
jgi:hypothetical protein